MESKFPAPPERGLRGRLAARLTAWAAGPGAAIAGRFDLGITILAFGIFLVGLLWGVVVLKVRAEREAAVATAAKHTANLARVFEEHTVRTLREVDQVLLFIQDMHQQHGGKPDLRRLAEDGPIISRIYTDFSFIDENGMLTNASAPFTPTNLADREYFRVHVAQDTGRLFIGRPVVERASGKQSIQLSRRINKPDLTFGGVVVVAMDPAYFSRLYSAVDLGRQGLVNVTGRDDKIIRARRVGDDTTVGQDASKGQLFTHLPTSEHGSYVSTGGMTGVSRILSYRALESYPLVVLVGVATAEALAGFHQRVRDYYVGAVLISAIILLLTAILMALTSRQKRLAEDLRRRNIELTQAEGAARAGGQHSRQLATIVATSRDAIISRGTDGTILTWNPSAERVFGWSAEEAVGRHISIFIPPGHEDEVRRNMGMLHRGEPVAAYDTVRRRKDGQLFDVSLTQSPIKNERGEVVAVSLIFRDISQRKQAEEAVRASEARLRTILDAEPECVKVVAPDGSLLEINRAGLAMLEADSIEQAASHGLSNFVLAEHGHHFAESFARVLGGESCVFEFGIVGLKGTHRHLESHATPMRLPETGAIAMLAISRDVTERKQAQEQIAFLSQYDTLTGLPNRNLFRDRLALAIARAKRQRELVGIMLFNLDRFKQVNEGLGLEAGDDLLRRVAARLKETLRDVDTIARLGSDEFAILVEGVPASADVTAVAEKLIHAFAAPFEVSGTEVVTTPSIGITIHPDGTEDPQTLLEHAEIAMNRVKREGGGAYQLYEDDPITHRGQRLDMETRLRHALERGEFELHYQPKVRLMDGDVTGAEALLRWHNPELGAVSPAKFIPIAEESGLIIPIGEWVLRAACAQMHRWHVQGHAIGIAVNLSPRQFRQKDLASTVAEALRQSGLAPQHLELEITEGTAMANAQQTVRVLGALHGLGVKLAVDDFGTGYSSLAYLKRFLLDSLKIDRSFVVDVGADTNSDAIVCATIALAQSLKLRAVAEGVETEAQRDFLERAGCDEMQGYLYSRPLPAAAFLALLQQAVRPRS